MRVDDETTSASFSPEPNPAQPKKSVPVLFVLVALLVIAFIGGTFFVLKDLLPKLTARTLAISNMRILSRAAAIYAFDNDEFTPPTAAWMDSLTPYTPIDTHPFHSPSVFLDGHNMGQYGVAMNQTDSSVPYLSEQGASQEPLFFESKLLNRNASGPFPGSAIGRYAGPSQSVIPVAGFQLRYGIYLTKINRIRWMNGRKLHL